VQRLGSCHQEPWGSRRDRPGQLSTDQDLARLRSSGRDVIATTNIRRFRRHTALVTRPTARATKLPVVSSAQDPGLPFVVVINCQLPLAHGREWLATLENGMAWQFACDCEWIQVVGLLYRVTSQRHHNLFFSPSRLPLTSFPASCSHNSDPLLLFSYPRSLPANIYIIDL